jgi:DNA polymerase/3'-5' exonuclease PolX
MSIDRKAAILDALSVLEQSDTARGERFAAAAYKKVLGQIKTLPHVYTMDDLASVNGIGAKMKLKMNELLETGKLQSAEHAKANPEFAAYQALLNVYGIGPVKAKKFVEDGVDSIEELRRRAAADPDFLTAAQKLGLQYYEDSIERIERAEIDRHAIVLKKAFVTGAGLQMEIVGSYRRGVANSGDIDVLITAAPGQTKKSAAAAFKKAVDQLIEDEYILGVLARGPAKTLAFAGVSDGLKTPGRRLDLLLTDPEEFAYAILYFTGSDQFNIAMRRAALDQGYTMNEHTMTPTCSDAPSPPPMHSERNIFDYLGLVWVEPTERRDGGQVVETTATAAVATRSPQEILASMRAKKASAGK